MGWLGVIKTKARSTIQSLEKNVPETTHAYQDDAEQQMPVFVSDDDFQQCIVDTNGVEEVVPISVLDQLDLDIEEQYDEFEEEEEEEDDYEEVEVEVEVEEEIEVEEEEVDEFRRGKRRRAI